MRRTILADALTVAAGLAATACTEPATSPVQRAAALSAASQAAAPDNGVVYRYQEEFAVCWTDFSNGLRVCHRTQQFPSGDCGTFEPIGGISRQDVVTVTDPDDFFATWIHANEKGQLWITVRDLTRPGSCYGATRVAEGWGSVHYTDNDVIGTDPSSHNSNASSVRGDGALTTSDGRRVQYSGHTHVVFNPDRGIIMGQSSVNVR